jgi:hypothetical protein
VFFGDSRVIGTRGREGSGDMSISEPRFGASRVPEVDGRSFEVKVIELLQQRMFG